MNFGSYQAFLAWRFSNSKRNWDQSPFGPRASINDTLPLVSLWLLSKGNETPASIMGSSKEFLSDRKSRPLLINSHKVASLSNWIFSELDTSSLASTCYSFLVEIITVPLFKRCSCAITHSFSFSFFLLLLPFFFFRFSFFMDNS